jgi:hypothetical protein
VHPRAWGLRDRARFEQILDFLIPRRRFSTPAAWARWEADRPKISVEKIGPAHYRVDLNDASYSHRFQIAGSTR